jgi:hypothetical protein
MDRDPIPASTRADVEEAVAEALDLEDLRRGVRALLPEGDGPPPVDEVDLVVLWVWTTRSGRWPHGFRSADDARPLINGAIVAAVQAHDVAAGRKPRPVRPNQREWLARWEAEVGTGR